jgi:hypothetical protein
MKNLRIALSFAVPCLILSISVFAASISIEIPLAFSQFIPCANQGNGETVDFSGTLHGVISSTVNRNNVHLNQLFNPQGVKGIGETTGDVWQATGDTRQDINASVNAFPFEATFVNNFRLVDGRDGSFLMHENLHVTVLADGTTTASHDHFTFTCK